jgi:DHA1 family tetracycline resistance protein-like MFS transporter
MLQLVFSQGTSVAYIADLMPPENRAAATGLLLGCMCLAILGAPMVGAAMGDHITLLFTTSGLATLVAPVFAYCFLPESLPASHHKPLEWGNLNPFSTLSMLNRNRLFRRLTACAMASGIALDGMQGILIYYLKEQFGFTAVDLGGILLAYGTGGFIIQCFLLKPLRDCLGERKLLVFGLSMLCVNQVILASIPPSWGKKAVIANTFFTSPWGYVSMPAISAIKANNVRESEQGSIQGALFGAQSLATGFAPLVMGALYHWAASRGCAPIVFYFSSSIALLGAIIAVSIPVGRGGALKADEEEAAEKDEGFEWSRRGVQSNPRSFVS